MYKLFPLTLTHDRRKVPVKGFKWKEDCTSDQTIINSWTQQYPQLKFYGLPCGKDNGLLVLDVDVKGGGLETIKNYHVPLTKSQTTLSGGKHYIFKYPDDSKVYGNRVGFDSGLDIRGESGYIAYYGFDETPIAEAPDWLLEQALSQKKEVNLEDAAKVAPDIINKTIAEACENIRNAPDGESNNVLNIEAYKVGQVVSENESEYAYTELFKAAKDRGKNDYEAKATINSGLSGGAKNAVTSPFGNVAPVLIVPIVEPEVSDRWTPSFFTRYDLTNRSKLKKPQLFKDWSTEDIHITTADGGTGKTTLKLNEAIALALGEDFLGFPCLTPGRTLFITGEDTWEKLGAMLGAILHQMKLLDGTPENDAKVRKITDSVLVKKDGDLCIITKNKQGFMVPNMEAFNKVMEAVEDIRPKMIVFDPISSFWGSESAVNDMAKAVSKFMGMLVEQSGACVEIVNHMGKASSKDKDMSQFAGRGGTGLPSHARVSRVLRPVFDEEYEELCGMTIAEGQTSMLCNVNKFSDGSPLYNKPFLILREGFLFSRQVLVERKLREAQDKMTDGERLFTYIRDERNEKRYPTKKVISAHFRDSSDKIGRDRINSGLGVLEYTGHMGEKIKLIENPDPDVRERVFIITDMDGKEL